MDGGNGAGIERENVHLLVLKYQKLQKVYHEVNNASKPTSSGYRTFLYDDIHNHDHKLPSNSFPTSLINASLGNASFFDNTVP